MPKTYKEKKVEVKTLAKATYPKTVAYPKEDSKDYFEEYTKWEESQKVSKENINDFLKTTMSTMITSDKENQIYSPLNLYIGYSLLAEITGGNSRNQILNALGIDSVETLRKKVNDLWQANYKDDGVTTSLLANSLWLNENMDYNQQTVDVLKDQYYASSYQGTMGSPEYDKVLQDWMNENTKNLLKESVSNDAKMSENTILALVSTIYYKANWQEQFVDTMTKKQTFHGATKDVNVDFLNEFSSNDSYYETDKFRAVSKEMQNGGKMWFILPNEDSSVKEVVNGKEITNLLTSKIKEQENVGVSLSVPKFDVQSNIGLKESMNKLGIVDVFKNADLSAITKEDGLLSAAQHAARVKINEEGCEGAAYTIFMVEKGMAMPQKK
ncbi:Serpin 1 [Lachnospiraceae bacterium TWA4]|nr:Serpin 1 [Lachnospiraceae bacterium TWA4]